MRTGRKSSILQQVIVSILLCAVVASAIVGLVIANQAAVMLEEVEAQIAENKISDTSLPSPNALRRELIVNSFILVVIVGLFSLFVAFTLGYRIIQPLENIIDYIPILSRGNFEVPMDEELHSYKNEIGTLAAAFEDMRTQLQTSFNHINNMNRTLEKTVEERTHELIEVNAELQSSLKELQDTQDQLVESRKQAAISSMIKGVSHLLNTPLGNAITSVTFLEMQLCQEQECAEHIQETLDVTLENLRNSRDILESFKRIAPDEINNTRETLNLSDYVERCVNILSADQKFERLFIELKLEADVFIDGSPSVLLQTLSTLMDNTLEHGYPNGEDGHVLIATRMIGNTAELDYMDWGVGISEETVPQVFDPFFSTKRSGKKSGLGLSVIYAQIKNLLSGTIRCLPQPKGTRFIIQLPKSEGSHVTH